MFNVFWKQSRKNKTNHHNLGKELRVEMRPVHFANINNHLCNLRVCVCVCVCVCVGVCVCVRMCGCVRGKRW